MTAESEAVDIGIAFTLGIVAYPALIACGGNVGLKDRADIVGTKCTV